MTAPAVIEPDWPAPDHVRALSTTRLGGVSSGPWKSLNLGFHTGDDPAHVRRNHELLNQLLPAEPLWMRQVHGARVLGPDHSEGGMQDADARVATQHGEVLAVMTADCLPVLLCDEAGGTVAVAHAGWRGLASGVIEATVSAMGVPPRTLMAWLGPAIGGQVYEVGDDVRRAFEGSVSLPGDAVPPGFTRHRDRWRLDIPEVARAILSSLGVERVFGGGFCTFSDRERFFSHRRDGVTGRMATLIWKAEN